MISYQRNPAIEAAPIVEETILFHPEKAKFFVLNRSSSFLWSQLARPATAGHLADALCGSFAEVTRDRALPDVEGALQQMLDMQLIEVANGGSAVDPPSPRGG